MLPTPTTSHVSFDRIYEPAEDSFLLLDTLSNPNERTWLTSRAAGRVPLVVEIGPGSGVVIAFFTANSEAIFGTPVLSLAVDINSHACIAAQTTVTRAIADQNSKSVYLGSLNGDLCSMVQQHSVDVLIFNPPYVPTEDLPIQPQIYKARDAFDRDSHLLALSYAGGKDGMEITDRLLSQLRTILSPVGVAYILLCKGNKPEEVKSGIRSWPDGPWHAETVGTSGKTAGWEKLEIVRIWKATRSV